MATKGKRRDEGGSQAEQGRIEGPHGDTEMDEAIDDLEDAGLAAGGRGDVDRALGHTGAGRREEIAANPENEEAADEALSGTSEEEDEAQTHDRKRRR